jgi:hypothetical protein
MNGHGAPVPIHTGNRPQFWVRRVNSASICSSPFGFASKPKPYLLFFLTVIPPPVLVKTEPQEVTAPRRSVDIKMRALNAGGQEVFELISDSEPEVDEPDSDVEVVEALRHTSRSSSTIPSSGE